MVMGLGLRLFSGSFSSGLEKGKCKRKQQVSFAN